VESKSTVSNEVWTQRHTNRQPGKTDRQHTHTHTDTHTDARTHRQHSVLIQRT